MVLHVNNSFLDNLDFATGTAGRACFSMSLSNLNGVVVGNLDHRLDVSLGNSNEFTDLSDNSGSLRSSNGSKSHSVSMEGSHTNDTGSSHASHSSNSSSSHHFGVSDLLEVSGTTGGHHSSVVHSSSGHVSFTFGDAGTSDSEPLGSLSGSNGTSSASEVSHSDSVASHGISSSDSELNFTTVSSDDCQSSSVGLSSSVSHSSGVSHSHGAENSEFVGSESSSTTNGGNSSGMVTSSNHDSSSVSTDGHSSSMSDESS